MNRYRSFTNARESLTSRFRLYGSDVHTAKWQGTDVTKRPDMVTRELLMQAFSINLFGIMDLAYWARDIQPNLPWADDHFLERVSGAPLNPGLQWRNWPWAASADGHRDDYGMFNHTYMERLWPRWAGRLGSTETAGQAKEIIQYRGSRLGWPNPHRGIRGEYGDLGTLVDKLAWEPDTRQGYIPLYFPEDTGADGRMPCTLGYQLIVRDQRLHMYYPLRSCDFIRHWGDDCYLAVRLLLWVIDECRRINPSVWDDIIPGDYVMHMTSLHIFANDWIRMQKDAQP